MRKNLVEKRCIECHDKFNNLPEIPEPQRDAAVARYFLSQSGWITPGDLESSKVHKRTRGVPGLLMMPPGGETLSSDPEHQRVLGELDAFILNMVPGKRMIVTPTRAPVAVVRGDSGMTPCGMVPTGTVVVVTEEKAAKGPSFVGIWKPADRFLNGACPGTKNFYVYRSMLSPVPVRRR